MLLVVFVARIALVLSQDDSDKRIGGTLPPSRHIVHQLASIAANQRRLMKLMRERETAIARLKETFNELTEFLDVFLEKRQSATPMSHLHYYLVPNSTDLQAISY